MKKKKTRSAKLRLPWVPAAAGCECNTTCLCKTGVAIGADSFGRAAQT
jgi:hypothetical protein